ncbi:hypothetical protein HOLleu_06308 [Holothuria leucospilota]|uniref:Uncharacterized protein n=1 Tax=Holothuria leucospilota TaxID=206669 RepID=A0A9Q1CLX2_HOLLE|nr:hypothetical protein HOLleu_06308 [Holothuria leucospilota]
MVQKYPSVDQRVQVLDGWTVATGMRHDTEKSPMIMGSPHWHRWCNELNGEMRVCGNPTEMVAQILLGKVLAPDGKKSWLKSVESQVQQRVTLSVPREILLCHDCPESLLPFHVKRVPELKCYKSTKGLNKGFLKNVHVWNGSMCPTDCMKTEPTGKATTNSGMVDVRECFVLL